MATASGFFEGDTPHGNIKRVMWFKYLQSFIAKTQQSRSGNIDKTIICDVFAGTGVYEEKGWSPCFTDYGSPLVALRAAIGYFIWKKKLPNTFEPIQGANPDYTEDKTSILDEYKIDLYFVEKVGKNYKSLIKNIILFFNFHGIRVQATQNPKKASVSSTNESFPICCKIFHCEFTEFPAPDVPHNARMATFIDPFGFAMIPWRKVSQFVGEHKDLYINLMTSFMHRFFTMTLEKIGEVFGIDPKKLQILREGEEEESNFVDRLANLYVKKLDLYVEELEISNFALTFKVRNKGNVRLYHLIFATSHIEGLKSMKESFNRGTQEQHKFSLSDFKILSENIPLNLRNEQDSKQVAKVIFDEFKGRLNVSIKDIEMFVWCDTPYVYRKTPLAILEKNRKIVNVVAQRRRYTFPDHTVWLISFASE